MILHAYPLLGGSRGTTGTLFNLAGKLDASLEHVMEQ